VRQSRGFMQTTHAWSSRRSTFSSQESEPDGCQVPTRLRFKIRGFI
jgi:hypothetical protein